jgi:hypothetical protein
MWDSNNSSGVGGGVLSVLGEEQAVLLDGPSLSLPEHSGHMYGEHLQPGECWGCSWGPGMCGNLFPLCSVYRRVCTRAYASVWLLAACL